MRTSLGAQRVPKPRRPRGIVSIGAGAIVRAAHVPAYASARLPIVGVYDVRRRASSALARALGVRRFDSLDEALAEDECVFDVAVPPSELEKILGSARPGSALLVQKPFGRDAGEARVLAAIARRRRLTVSVNFQLRFSPAVRALRAVIAARELGAVREASVRIVTHTPFERWSFLAAAPRLEILYHSIHYLDLARALFGEPLELRARAMRDPLHPRLSDTRSEIEIGFAKGVRFTVHTNHASTLHPSRRVSEMTVEGTRGAARIVLGVNLDYAAPRPDELEISRGSRRRSVRLEGSWFPDAFAGPMSNLQRYVMGEDQRLESSAADAVRTMELVEACYASSRAKGRR